ncbi:hypothetical protein ACWN9M_07370 [Leuconostoc lactis]
MFLNKFKNKTVDLEDMSYYTSGQYRKINDMLTGKRETPSVTVKVDTRELVEKLNETRSVVNKLVDKVESFQRTQDNQRKEIERLTGIVIEHDTHFMKRIKGL